MNKKTKTTLLLTCEHATNAIPADYQFLFLPKRIIRGPWGKKRTTATLNDHWGFDIGAKSVAQSIKQSLRVSLFCFPVSRLLIEGNRYRESRLYSSFTSTLSAAEKRKLKEKYYWPHVEKIKQFIQNQKRTTTVAQFAIHSFTPVRNGIMRNADIGILFDPKRAPERKTAHFLQRELRAKLAGLRIRRNYPYTGRSEGIPTFFRKKFSQKKYQGFEIEINNKHLNENNPEKKRIQKALAQVIQELALHSTN